MVRLVGDRNMPVEMLIIFGAGLLDHCVTLSARHSLLLGPIGLIIQDIIHDAVVNRCGRLSHVALGFLNKISQAVAASAVPDGSRA
jgi:hypothetical protein